MSAGLLKALEGGWRGEGIGEYPPTVAPFGRESAPDYAPVAGAILVEHSIFMGKDSGCTVYLHPEDAKLI